MFSTTFTAIEKTKEYRDTLLADRAKLGKFISAMHDEGIRIIGRGLWYISAAHVEADIDHALETAEKVLARLEQ